VAVQWAHLGAGRLLVASERGAWLQPNVLGLPAIEGPMPDSLVASARTTRHLLDGAIAAAERHAPPAQPPPMTRVRWAWNLVGQFYCAHHSISLLAEAVGRFEALNRTDLRNFTAHKLAEEQGHDRYPLADLRALGYDAEQLVGGLPPPPTAAAYVEYAAGCVRGEHPAEFLGYIHAIERNLTRLSSDCLAAIDALVPPGVEASSMLRTHATELDVEHVNDAIAFFAGLPGEDRSRIALGCYRTNQLRSNPQPDSFASDAELEQSLSRFQRAGV
jgi:hypothetical protein